jgi:hypothetical protein
MEKKGKKEKNVPICAAKLGRTWFWDVQSGSPLFGLALLQTFQEYTVYSP